MAKMQVVLSLKLNLNIQSHRWEQLAVELMDLKCKIAEFLDGTIRTPFVLERKEKDQDIIVLTELMEKMHHLFNKLPHLNQFVMEPMVTQVQTADLHRFARDNQTKSQAKPAELQVHPHLQKLLYRLSRNTTSLLALT
jgi:hypothetical protein